MICNIICFTDKGEELANRIVNSFSLDGNNKDKYIVNRCKDGELSELTKKAFVEGQAIIFIGAAGIAVRAIAPFINSKLSDPAVIVIDELGNNIIPILSGHVGGANELAISIRDNLCTASHVAITTATDVEGKFSIDLWAKKNGLCIYNKSGIKYVASKILKDEDVNIGRDINITYKNKDLRINDASVLNLICPVYVGIGCKRGTDVNEIDAIFSHTINEYGIIPESVRLVASIDVKANEPGLLAFANNKNIDFITYSADELRNVPGKYNDSDFVMKNVGVGNVCERSAVKACISRHGLAELVISKTSMNGVTMAVAIPDIQMLKDKLEKELSSDLEQSKTGNISVVGMGPGSLKGMTIDAIKAIERADIVVGYTKYIQLLKNSFTYKETYSTGMKQEKERCLEALDMALGGKDVAVVCSGDAGVYGMAGLIIELAGLHSKYESIDINVIPGVTAALSGGALLGAPLGHDFSVISLSDLLTPLEVIKNRLESAAMSDMCIALYNPSSKNRSDYLKMACEILLKYKPENTVCGIAMNIGRDGENIHITSLGELMDIETDMFSTVFIGNKSTLAINGKMVTPRGYSVNE